MRNAKGIMGNNSGLGIFKWQALSQEDNPFAFVMHKVIYYRVLIQYRGEAEVVSANTVGCSLELPGLCPGQYLPPGRSP